MTSRAKDVFGKREFVSPSKLIEDETKQSSKHIGLTVYFRG